MLDSNIDVLFINVGGSKKRVYQELSKDYSAIEPPFWAALTAGFVRKKGFNVDIIDASAENLTFEETAELVKQKNPKFVNIIIYGQHPAASTPLMPSVSELCKQIKLIDPERKIVLTGLHSSALPKRTLQEEQCDFVAQGEGFYTLLGLLENKKLNEIPGLWYKEVGEIKSNLRAPLVQNLTEELDEVAWDLLPLTENKYKAHNWQCLDDLSQRPRYASISTSMGCPFRCHFCSISATFGGEKGIRYWSPEWMLKQIDILVQKYNIKVIKIIDEMFVFNPNHFLAIADGIIERGYDLNIWAYARVDTLKEEYLDKLKRAGFKWLSFGFEAANDFVRKNVEKGKFSIQNMVDIKKKVEKHGINIIGNFIFGLPEDDLESMQETLKLAQELNCEYVNVYCAMAYPGSALYQEAVEKSWKLPDSWGGYSQHSFDCLPLQTNKVSAKQVLEFRDYAFDTYFKNPKYLNIIEKKFGKQARIHLEEMTKVKLKRKLLGHVKEEPQSSQEQKNKIKVEKTKLKDVLLFQPPIFEDFRGTYFESYNDEDYSKIIKDYAGKDIKFVQDDFSVSKKNVLRGINVELEGWKLVSCPFGKIYFVVVNCDESSEDFGKWQSFILSQENGKQVLLPPKYGNAHLTLSDKAVFHYKQTKYFDPDNLKRKNYKYNDIRFNIFWPEKSPITSEKDIC